MKVKELIVELQKLNPESEIFSNDEDEQYNPLDISVSEGRIDLEDSEYNGDTVAILDIDYGR